MTARTGDAIHTVEELEALPDRSVILDLHGDAWQQTGTLQEGDTTQAAWLGHVPVSCRQSSAVDLPARVLHVPGEKEPAGDDVIEQAARVIHGEVVLAAQSREIDIQVHDTVPSIRFERGIARALAVEGLLAEPRPLPSRDEIARAIYGPPDVLGRGFDEAQRVATGDTHDAGLFAMRLGASYATADAVLELLEERKR